MCGRTGREEHHQLPAGQGHHKTTPAGRGLSHNFPSGDPRQRSSKLSNAYLPLENKIITAAVDIMGVSSADSKRTDLFISMNCGNNYTFPNTFSAFVSKVFYRLLFESCNIKV